MYWIVGVVILCLIILLWQMTIIGRPIEWKERSNNIKNLTETDEEIRDAEARIQELYAERVKLHNLKKLNNKKFKVSEDVEKLRKEIERIGAGGSE